MAQKSANASAAAHARTFSPAETAFIADMLHCAAAYLREQRSRHGSIVAAFQEKAAQAEALADTLELS